MSEQLPEWRVKALQDPYLPETHVRVLMNGPESLAEAFILQAIKLKYTLRK